MCADEGMGLAPWGSLGGGNFKTKKQREEMKGEGRNMGAPSENHIKLTDALEKIADRKSTAITSVALAYVMHKAPYVFPIVGGKLSFRPSLPFSSYFGGRRPVPPPETCFLTLEPSFKEKY